MKSTDTITTTANHTNTMTKQTHISKITLGLIFGTLVGCGGGATSSNEDSSDKSKAEPASEEKKDEGAKKPAPSEPKERTYKKFDAGKTPIELSGWKGKVRGGVMGNTKNKYVEMSYKLKALAKMKVGDRLDLKATCKLGDQYLVDLTTGMLGMDKLEAGETKQLSSGLHGLNGIPGQPEKCQITALFIPGDDIDPYLVGEYCFDGKETSEGPCKDFAPKAPSGGSAKITNLTAKLTKVKFGPSKGNKELRVEYAVVPGKLMDDGEAVFMKAACQVGGEKIVNEQPTAVSVLKQVNPGEAVLVSREAFTGSGLASDPTQCELKFKLMSMFGSDGEQIGTFCFKDGKVTEGAC